MTTRIQSFKCEEQLRSSFVEKAFTSCLIKEKNLERIHHQESKCSEGRADLVFGKICRCWTSSIKPSQSILFKQPTCSKILNTLKPSSGRTESFLLPKIGVTSSTLRYWLNRLENENLISRIDENKYVLSSNFYLPKAEILSYEFKLNNWKRALFQATRYRTFSHQVFVVMPPESSHLISKNIDIFKRFNVGIMTHDINGRTKTIFSPRKQMPLSRVNFLMALGMLQSNSSTRVK